MNPTKIKVLKGKDWISFYLFTLLKGILYNHDKKKKVYMYIDIYLYLIEYLVISNALSNYMYFSEYVREVFLVMQLPKRFKEDLSYSRNFSRNYLYKRVKTWTVNQKVQLIIISGRQTLGK